MQKKEFWSSDEITPCIRAISLKFAEASSMSRYAWCFTVSRLSGFSGLLSLPRFKISKFFSSTPKAYEMISVSIFWDSASNSLTSPNLLNLVATSVYLIKLRISQFLILTLKFNAKASFPLSDAKDY